MVWRNVLLLAVAVLASGCVTTRNGVDFVSMSQKLGPPKSGQARVVIFREPAFSGLIDQGWDVKLDDAPMGELKTGTFRYADRPAGRHQLSYTEAFFPGESQRDITLSQGRTYFFLVKMSDRATKLHSAQAAGGLTGLVVVSAMTAGDNNPGPLDFIPLEETAAREAIAALKLGE